MPNFVSGGHSRVNLRRHELLVRFFTKAVLENFLCQRKHRAMIKDGTYRGAAELVSNFEISIYIHQRLTIGLRREPSELFSK